MSDQNDRLARRTRLASIIQRHAPSMSTPTAMSLSACCRTQQHAVDLAAAWERQGGRCALLGFPFTEPREMDSVDPLVPFYSTHHKHIACRVVAKAQGTMQTDVFRVMSMRVFYAANRIVVGPPGPDGQTSRVPGGPPRAADLGHGYWTATQSLLAKTGPVRGGLG